MNKKRVMIICVVIAITITIIGLVFSLKNETKTIPTAFFSVEKHNLKDNYEELTELAKIKDTTAPVITLKGKKEVTVNLGEEYKDEGCVAEDNQDGEITNQVVITGKVDTKKEGSYTITYQVEDSSGNKAEKTRKVKVKKKKEEDNNQTVATSASTTNSKEDKSKKGLPVLMYHFFYDAKKGEKGADNNWMEV